MSLVAHSLSCQRGEVLLYENLSFAVEAGEAVQILGPNGAGKTSLLRQLAGLARIDAGKVLWDGLEIQRGRLAYAAECLWIGHRLGLKPELSPLENLRALTALRGQPSDDAAIEAALARLGILQVADQPCATLSAGQQRRAALARLLLEPARLWLLDEPNTALDKAGQAQLGELLAAHVAAGGMLLFTAHQDIDLPGQSLRALELPGARAQVLV